MSDRRFFRWASTSARMLAGTVVAAGAVVAVATAVTLPWPTLEREPVAVSAKPAPADTVIACAGGLLALGRDLDSPSDLALVAPQTVTVGALPDAPQPEGRSLIGSAPGASPQAYTAPPSGAERTDVAASGSMTADSDDMAGFAASACRPPLMESWIVAGSAATGSADFVLLSNPGTVGATVQLTVYGATGPETPPGGSNLVVAAGAQRVVPLAGLVRGETSPVVRVSAVGAPVQASVQSSLTRVLEPLGVDQTGGVGATAPVQRILGVVVTESDVASPTGAGTVLRVLSPGADTEATVMVRAVGGDQQMLEPLSVPLAAGVPTEVGLGGLAEGEYDVEVIAGSPVVAGLWQASGFEEGADFAWLLPSPEITVPSLFAVPVGPDATLTVANPGEAPVTVAVTDRTGSLAGELMLEPGESATLGVQSRTIYTLDSGGAPVLAAVTMSGPGALAGFPIWPADAAAPAIRVYP
ncbi:DUF5719 family protein [Microbacterium sp. NPDC055910]|uniref:DUF5719 family protein n=1 Tax=Microbacterium sp. NPDC055910 TaxID=3345659 RepID=UPI0035DB2EF3